MLFIKLLEVVVFYFSVFLNSQLLCIFSTYLYWMRKKTPKRLHTKEQSLLFPEIDGCLWGNPACNFKILQVHCKLNHVASTQIIPSFQNHSSEFPISLVPWIFLHWSAPAKPQPCAGGTPEGDGLPAVLVTPFITEAPPQCPPKHWALLVYFLLFLFQMRKF